MTLSFNTFPEAAGVLNGSSGSGDQPQTVTSKRKVGEIMGIELVFEVSRTVCDVCPGLSGKAIESGMVGGSLWDKV